MLAVRGVLLQAAEAGRITQVVCKMPECFCPEELGGACYFEPVAHPQTDWMPTPDHYPTPKKNGGHLTVDNVRLAPASPTPDRCCWLRGGDHGLFLIRRKASEKRSRTKGGGK